MPGRNMGLSVPSLVTADGTQVQCFWGALRLPRTLSRMVLNRLVFKQEEILLAALPLGESGRPCFGGLLWKPLGQNRAVGFVHRQYPPPARSVNLALARRSEAGRFPPARKDRAPTACTRGAQQETVRGRFPAPEPTPSSGRTRDEALAPLVSDAMFGERPTMPIT